MNETNSRCLFFVCFFWRVLLEYSSTFEPFILAFRKKKLKKKKENVAVWERATSKTVTLFGVSIFKTRIDMQVYDLHLHPQQPALWEHPHLSAVKYFPKEIHPRCLQVSRVPFWYIWYPNILISYFIYLQKTKKYGSFYTFLLVYCNYQNEEYYL